MHLSTRLRRGRLALVAALLAGSAPPTLGQDAIAPGFALTQTETLPAAFSAYATLPGGERVVFDGLSVDLYGPGNQLLLHLGDLPAFAFPSFLRISPDESFALLGETSAHQIYRVALDGSGMAPVANLVFNYDCAFESPTHVFVSAATCGFGCGNQIYRVETQGGGATLVAQVPGPSGPLARRADGRLFYATQSDQFPTPPGSSDIVYWTARQLSSGNLLGIADASLFSGGLDGASSLAIDPVFGNLLVAESVFFGTSRIAEFSGNGARVANVVTSLDYLSTLELIDGPGPGHFHAFQPEDGVWLHYGNGSEVKTVRPQRPRGEIHQAGSWVEFRVTGALPNSAFLLLWGPQASYDPQESAYGNFGSFLFLTGMPLSAIRRQPFLTPIDASGQGSFHFFDPGYLAGTLVFQGLISTGSGQGFVGSSSAALY